MFWAAISLLDLLFFNENQAQNRRLDEKDGPRRPREPAPCTPIWCILAALREHLLDWPRNQKLWLQLVFLAQQIQEFSQYEKACFITTALLDGAVQRDTHTADGAIEAG